MVSRRWSVVGGQWLPGQGVQTSQQLGVASILARMERVQVEAQRLLDGVQLFHEPQHLAQGVRDSDLQAIAALDRLGQRLKGGADGGIEAILLFQHRADVPLGGYRVPAIPRAGNLRADQRGIGVEGLLVHGLGDRHRCQRRAQRSRVGA